MRIKRAAAVVLCMVLLVTSLPTGWLENGSVMVEAAEPAGVLPDMFSEPSMPDFPEPEHEVPKLDYLEIPVPPIVRQEVSDIRQVEQEPDTQGSSKAKMTETEILELAVPKNLKAFYCEDSYIHLSWEGGKTSAVKYGIYRNGELYDTTASMQYDDYALEAGCEYSYYVKAMDGKEHLSAGSNTVLVKIGKSEEEEKEHLPAALDGSAGTVAAKGSFEAVNWVIYGNGRTVFTGRGAIDGSALSSFDEWNRYKGSITSVEIGEGITSIGSYAFFGCVNVKKTVIPRSIIGIYAYAFLNCTGLKQIDYAGCRTEWESIPVITGAIDPTVEINCRGSEYSAVVTEPTCISDGYTTYTRPDGTVYIDNIVSASGHQYTGGELAADTKNLVLYQRFVCSKCGAVRFAETENVEAAELFKIAAVNNGNAYLAVDTKMSWNEAETFCEKIGGHLVSIDTKEESEFVKTLVSAGNKTQYWIKDCGQGNVYRLVSEEEWDYGNLDSSAGDFAGGEVGLICEWESGIKEEKGSCGSELNWVLSLDGTLTISGSGAMANYKDKQSPWYPHSERITEVRFDGTVTAIGNYAFQNCHIDSISIPQTVTTIGERAFRDCGSLSVVELPQGLTKIYAEAFGQSAVTELILPGTIQGLNSNATSAFYNMKSLKKVVFADGTSAVPAYSFKNCSQVEEIMLPASVTTIGDYAFSGCKGLHSISLPSGVSRIGTGVFFGCSNISQFYVPEGVTEIGNQAFSACTALTAFTVPVSVKKIGNQAFKDCKNLQAVYLSEGLNTILNEAFAGTAITELAIPSTVTTLNYGSGDSASALYNMPNLKKVTFAEGMKVIPAYSLKNCAMVEQIVIPKSATALGVNAFEGCSQFKAAPLSDKITVIGAGAFKNCVNLTSAVLPENLMEIGSGAFEGTALIELTIPKNIKLLSTGTDDGCSAFYNAKKLRRVVFTEGLTEIPAYSFKNCPAVKQIVIPNSVAVIGGYAFQGCTQLNGSPLPDGIMVLSEGAFYNCTGLVEFVLPSGISSVGAYAFKNCSNLSSVILPEGLAAIGQEAFGGTAVTELSVPGSVVTLKSGTTTKCSAFYNAQQLRRVIFAEGIKAVPESSFYNCGSVKEVLLPKTAVSAGKNAFAGTTSELAVYYEGSEEEWKNTSISLPTNCTVSFGYGDTSIVYQDWDGEVLLTQKQVEWSIGETITIEGAENFAREGYLLKEWNTKADGSGTAYMPGEKAYFSVGEQINLYAVWAHYTQISYCGNSSDDDCKISKVFYDKNVKLEAEDLFTKTNYRFVGWNTNVDGSGTAYSAGEDVQFEDDTVTLYAQWEMEAYELVFDGNGNTGGVVPESILVADTAQQITLPDGQGLTRTAYVFKGWNTNADGSGTFYMPGNVAVFAEPVNRLYAVWMELLETEAPGGLCICEMTSGKAFGMSWNTDAEAVGYEVDLNGNCYTVTNPVFQYSGVLNNTSYSVRIRSVYANGYSRWSDPYKFTAVFGEISTDTVWNERYALFGGITVAEGITLTVRECAEVLILRGGQKEIIVNGTFICEGTDESQPVFANYNNTLVGGNSALTGWNGVQINKNGKACINKAKLYLYYSFDIYGDARIADSYLSAGFTGIRIWSEEKKLDIRNNVIEVYGQENGVYYDICSAVRVEKVTNVANRNISIKGNSLKICSTYLCFGGYPVAVNISGCRDDIFSLLADNTIYENENERSIVAVLCTDGIHDDITFSREFAEYAVVKGGIYIPEKYTLKIESGVTVYFYGDTYSSYQNPGLYAFDVAGTLELAGTEKEKVKIRRMYDSSWSHKYWDFYVSGIHWGAFYGIHVRETGLLSADYMEVMFGNAQREARFNVEGQMSLKNSRILSCNPLEEEGTPVLYLNTKYLPVIENCIFAFSEKSVSWSSENYKAEKIYRNRANNGIKSIINKNPDMTVNLVNCDYSCNGYSMLFDGKFAFPDQSAKFPSERPSPDSSLSYSNSDIAGIVRMYSSQMAQTDGGLGYGWFLNYECRAYSSYHKEGNLTRETVYVRMPDGSTLAFEWDYRQYISECLGYVLTTNEDDCFVLYTKDKEKYTFNERGCLVSMEDRNGNVTRITVDENDRILSVTDCTGRSSVFDYDAKGHIIRITDWTGASVAYGYNHFGYLVEAFRQDGTRKESFEYYNGLLGRIRNGNNETVKLIFYENHYGADKNKITSVTDKNGLCASYTYDNDNRILTITYDNGLVLKQYYNEYNLITDASSSFDKEELISHTVYHDKYGSIASVTDPYGNTTLFKVDSSGNQVEIIYPDGTKTSATFDEDTYAVCRYSEDAVTLINHYGDDGVYMVETYGDKLIGFYRSYGLTGTDIVHAYGALGACFLTKYGADFVNIYNRYGEDGVNAVYFSGSNGVSILKQQNGYSDTAMKLYREYGNAGFRLVILYGSRATEVYNQYEGENRKLAMQMALMFEADAFTVLSDAEYGEDPLKIFGKYGGAGFSLMRQFGNEFLQMYQGLSDVPAEGAQLSEREYLIYFLHYRWTAGFELLKTASSPECILYLYQKYGNSAIDLYDIYGVAVMNEFYERMAGHKVNYAAIYRALEVEYEEGQLGDDTYFDIAVEMLLNCGNMSKLLLSDLNLEWSAEIFGFSFWSNYAVDYYLVGRECGLAFVRNDKNRAVEYFRNYGYFGAAMLSQYGYNYSTLLYLTGKSVSPEGYIVETFDHGTGDFALENHTLNASRSSIGFSNDRFEDKFTLSFCFRFAEASVSSDLVYILAEKDGVQRCVTASASFTSLVFEDKTGFNTAENIHLGADDNNNLTNWNNMAVRYYNGGISFYLNNRNVFTSDLDGYVPKAVLIRAGDGSCTCYVDNVAFVDVSTNAFGELWNRPAMNTYAPRVTEADAREKLFSAGAYASYQVLETAVYEGVTLNDRYGAAARELYGRYNTDVLDIYREYGAKGIEPLLLYSDLIALYRAFPSRYKELIKLFEDTGRVGYAQVYLLNRNNPEFVGDFLDYLAEHPGESASAVIIAYSNGLKLMQAHGIETVLKIYDTYGNIGVNVLNRYGAKAAAVGVETVMAYGKGVLDIYPSSVLNHKEFIEFIADNGSAGIDLVKSCGNTAYEIYKQYKKAGMDVLCAWSEKKGAPELIKTIGVKAGEELPTTETSIIFVDTTIKNTNVLSTTDGCGNNTWFFYDERGNLIREAVPSNGKDVYNPQEKEKFSVVEYTYYTDAEADKMGCPVSGLPSRVRDAGGNDTSFLYDSVGNLVKKTDADQRSEGYVYDGCGRILKKTSPAGVVTEYTYDENGRLVKLTEAGVITRYEYDLSDRLVRVVCGDASRTDVYNAQGQLESRTDGEGYTTAYTYNKNGKVETETRPDGTVYRYVYDWQQRPERIYCRNVRTGEEILLTGYRYSVPKTGVTQVEERSYYDRDNYISTITQYDYAGREIRQIHADGTAAWYTYDANGNKTASFYGTSGEYYACDRFGRITERYRAVSKTQYAYTAYTYDKLGRLLSQTDGTDTVALTEKPEHFITHTWTYDIRGNVKTVSVDGILTEAYTYDADGRVTEKTIYRSAEKFQTISYTYDDSGRLSAEILYAKAGELAEEEPADESLIGLSTRYAYDAQGRKASETMADGTKYLYSYDKNGNLICRTIVDGDKKTTETWKYDEKGRILKHTTPNGHSTFFRYDDFAHTVWEIKAEDGSKWYGLGTIYAYDFTGRLIGTVLPEDAVFGADISCMDRVVYQYDALGRIAAKLLADYDEDLRRCTYQVLEQYVYDTAGNIIQKIDGAGARTAYTYDLTGNLLLVTDACGNVTEYAYDALGRTVCEKQPGTKALYYTYDSFGNRTQEAYREGGSAYVREILEYDLAGNLTAKTDAYGNRTVYTYNSLGQLSGVTHPSDDSIPEYRQEIQYDRQGNAALVTDNCGLEILSRYDGQGHLISETKRQTGTEIQSVTKTEYDADGNPVKKTAENGGITQLTYDIYGRVTETTDALGFKEQYAYDKNGNLIRHTNWLGQSRIYGYDRLGNRTRVTDENGIIIYTAEYDTEGRVLSKTDALGNTVRYEYDGLGHVIRETDALGAVTSCTYWENGKLHRKTDALGNTVWYWYDAYGNLSREVNDSYEKTSYGYDRFGTLAGTVLESGEMTVYNYNAAGLVSKKTDFFSKGTMTEQYSYTPDGKLAQIRYTDVDVKSDYDALGRLIGESESKNGQENALTTFTYDAAGNLLTAGAAAGTERYTYDLLGRVTEKETEAGTLTYTYDVTEYLNEGENLIEEGGFAEVLTAENGGETHITVSIYDRSGKLQKVLADGRQTAYYYNNNGTLLRTENANGTAAEYSYDANGRVTKITEYKNGETLSSSTYVYDAAGNLLRETTSDGRETAYAYDHSNRLIQVKETEATAWRETTYTYSGANVLSKTVTAEGEDPVQSVYHYDGGRLIEITVSAYTPENVYEEQYRENWYYDLRGNVSEKRRIEDGTNRSAGTYLYDSFNQMVLAITPETTVKNEYNALGLRVSKTVGQNPKTSCLLDQNRVALEIGADGITAYFYGNSLISRAAGEDNYHYHYNAHGDVTALTDKNGERAASYRYDAFGALLSKTGAIENHITYAGYQYDEETGLYYLNARMYDPASMRFLQCDTYAGRTMDALSLNRYAYAQGNPLRYYDPTGHTIEEVWSTVMSYVQGSILGEIIFSMGNFCNSVIDTGLQQSLKVGVYEAKDFAVNYLTYTASSLLIVTGAAVSVASMGSLTFGGVMLAGLGMGMISTGTSVAMRAYTENETYNGITGSFASYLTTAGLGFAAGFVSGTISSITGGLAGKLAGKAFASQSMSTAAKYAVKYSVNLGLETLGDAGAQYITTGEVDWKRAFESGLIDTAIGGVAEGVAATVKNWKQIKAGVKNFLSDELGEIEFSGVKSGGKADFYVTPEGSAISGADYHSLDDLDARKWYLSQETTIPDLIDYSQPLEQQAYQAFSLRNKFRTTARELMSNRKMAESLYITDPNYTWEEIIRKQVDKGLTGDDVYKAIMQSSQRSRTSVNKLLGLE